MNLEGPGLWCSMKNTSVKHLYVTDYKGKSENNFFAICGNTMTSDLYFDSDDKPKCKNCIKRSTR